MDFAALKDSLKRDWSAHSKWREEARDNYRFIAGDQWTSEERAYLDEQGRPPVVFNRTATIINAVAGSEINNRTEVKFLPREIGDVKPNEIYTKAAEWFRDQADAEEEESQAFYDLLVCGIGWTETRLDFDEDPEGAPEMDRIDPLEMCWDGAANRKGLEDSRRRFRVRQIPLSEAQEMFPEASVSDLDADWIDIERREGEEHRVVIGDQYADGDGEVSSPSDMVTIVQVQWRERERFVEYAVPQTGERGEMPASKFRAITKGMQAPPHRALTKWVYKQAFLGKTILRENQPARDCFTFCPMTGYWDSEKKCWYGLLRSMKDPQKFANKWLSQTLHIINANSKGGVMVESDAVDNPREFEDGWSSADGVSWVRPGANSSGKVQPKPMAPMPGALMGLTEFAITSIRDASGVNQELLGLRESNQPGVLEYQRKQSAMTTLAVLFDALRYYRKQNGKVLLSLISEHLADGRLVRIMQDDGIEQYVPLIRDPQTRRYDVIVDDAPSSPNNKEKVWEIITQMAPMLMQAGLPSSVWADMISYSPFPSTLVEKLREALTQGAEDPGAAQATQMQLAKMQADIEKTRSETAENQADTLAKMIEASIYRDKAGADIIETMTRVRGQQVSDMYAPARAEAEIAQRFMPQRMAPR